MIDHPARLGSGTDPGRLRLKAAFLLLAAALIHLLWWQISEPPTLFSDFFKAYYPAAEYLWENGLRAPWPLTEEGAGGFVNIPVIAWLFLPFVFLGEEPAGWTFLAINVLATAAATVGLLRLAEARILSCVGVALVLLVLVNGPLVNSLREGNTTQFVLLALVFGILLLRSGRPYLAGVIIGASALIKLPMLLVLAYFVWKRRWSVVAGAASSLGLVVGASIVLFGLDSHFGWFQCCVDPFLRGVIPAFNVQSIDGFIVRLDTGASRLREWDPLPRTTVHQIARIVSLGAVLIMTYLVLRQSHQPTDTGPGQQERNIRLEHLDIGVMVTLAVVCSPVSWSHYYLLLLLPWTLLLREVMAGDGDWRIRTLTIVSMLLASPPIIDVPDGPAMLREILARTLISSWLFGGLALLAALLVARRRNFALAFPFGATSTRERDAIGCAKSTVGDHIAKRGW